MTTQAPASDWQRFVFPMQGSCAADAFVNDGPDAPTGLTITGLPFQIKIEVTPPAFWLKGSVIEIWQHTSATPFASATKVAEGIETVFMIPAFDVEPKYFWARMRSPQGQLSSTYPATNGQSGGMFINAAQRMCVDAEVASADPSLYWSPDNGKASVSAGGGIVGGVLTLAANGAAPSPGIRPIRPGGLLQASQGMQVKVRMRYRRTTALSTTDASNPTLSILLYSFQTASGGSNNQQDFKQISLAGLTLNQWYESSVTLDVLVNTITSFASARPFVNLLCFLDTQAQTGSASGTVEIDLYEAIIVA